LSNGKGKPQTGDIISFNRTASDVDDHGDSQQSDNSSVLDDNKVTACASDHSEPLVDDFTSLAHWQPEAS
jgi:hypothetical protein